MRSLCVSCVLCFSVLLALPSVARADGLDGVPVRLGAFAPYAIQPGGRLAAFYAFHLDPPDATLDTDVLRTNLFVGPEVAVFTRPQVHTSVLAGVLFGYRLLTQPRDRFHEFALGAAYLAEFQIVSLDVELATGDLTKNRELRNYLVPTVHYTFGRELSGVWGWYLDVAVGRMMSREVPSALYFNAGAGVQVRLGGGGG
ncbi:MAG: hypothetical protein AAFS10_14840 [Myxococcota bacterium]